MRPSKHLLIFIIGFALVTAIGCTKPQKADDGVNGPGRASGASPGASFYVSSCDGKAGTKDIVENPYWSIPTIADVRLSACLLDRATTRKAIGQEFEIEDPVTHKRFKPDPQNPDDAPGRSGNDGCISWHEDLPYNYFVKRSAPIAFTRLIWGNGIHTGNYRLTYAINPWATGQDARDRGHSNPDVQCLFGKEATPPAHMIKDHVQGMSLLAGENDAADLWIRNVRIKTITRKDTAAGEVLELGLTMKPKVMMKTADGEETPKELNTGRFEVFAHLIGTEVDGNESKKVILTTGQLSSTGKVRDGDLIVHLHTTLLRNIAGGNVQLVMKIMPVGLPHSSSIKPYEGVFDLGSISRLGRDPDAEITEACIDGTAGCNMFDLLSRASNYDDLKSDDLTAMDLAAAGFVKFSDLRDRGYAYNHEPLSFTDIKLRFVSVAAQPAETATQRTIAYSAETCINRRLSGEIVSEMPFQIDYLNEKDEVIPEEHQEASTDAKGCLHWTASVWHKFYMPEQFITKKVRITKGETGAGSTKSYVLNPWDFGFTFGFDSHELGPNYMRDIKKRKKIRSRFFTHGYGYHTIRFLYSFDKYMQLEVKKTVLVEIEPRVLRYSGIMNARRTVESLRDGIYLMKVALQKDFLDPATNKVRIGPSKRQGRGTAMSPTDRDPKANEIAKNEYITTFTSLVRVVDGRIIKPVELTIRDLRLMRIRSNFLIQLEPIDERLLWQDPIMQGDYGKEMEASRNKHKAENLSMEDYVAKINQDEEETKDRLKTAFFAIKEDLKNQSDLYQDRKIIPELQDAVHKAIESNDFTEANLPNCDVTDCNRFRENPPDYTEEMVNEGIGTGLMARTFVGPVIYLSNGYSDAVRATDNLDEACKTVNNPKWTDKQKRRFASPFLRADNKVMGSQNAITDGGGTIPGLGEKDWYGKAEADAENYKQNLAYRYSPYFGSLSRLCYMDVDTLIEREQVQNAKRLQDMQVKASIGNFAYNNDLDYLTLNEENQKTVGEVGANVLSREETLRRLNANFSSHNNGGLLHLFLSQNFNGTGLPYTADDLTQAFFGSEEHQILPAQAFAACSAITNRIEEDLQADKSAFTPRRNSRGEMKFDHKKTHLGEIAFNACISHPNENLILDEKLRVIEQGQYTFDGALQMNINAGESFSVSRSNSRGSSLEWTDILSGAINIGTVLGGAELMGPVGALLGEATGKVVNSLIKPFSLKASYSLGDSDGTSVSAQTYLVSQIAKFDLNLKSYERCRVFTLSNDWIAGKMKWLEGPAPEMNRIYSILSRGIFVCEGKIQVPSNGRDVKEDYFYFTQHFTEGDMLDMGDLLNHPWLLSLRGDRDFGVFINFLKGRNGTGQENVGFSEFHFGSPLANNPDRAVDWPLKNLADTYKQMKASFPGFYTVLKEDERLTKYPVGDRKIRIDDDFREVCNRKEGCDEIDVGKPPGEDFPKSSNQGYNTAPDEKPLQQDPAK
jgi:hypothetical protein